MNDSRISSDMRTEYRVLSEEEKIYMREAKATGEQFTSLITSLERLHPDSRSLAIARERLQEAIFWTCYEITR